MGNINEEEMKGFSLTRRNETKSVFLDCRQIVRSEDFASHDDFSKIFSNRFKNDKARNISK
jgi:hypothetical protein